MKAYTIENVKVFDGEHISGPRTVAFENGLITDGADGGTVIDGSGCFLLPGLIDAHVHIDNAEQLLRAAKLGVTTMFEMAHYSAEALNGLRSMEGCASLISCAYPATAEPKMNYPAGSIVKSCEDAERYVGEVVALGADFIKIFVEEPMRNAVTRKIPKVLSNEVIAAIAEAAHKRGKLTVAHVTTPYSYKRAIDAGVDILTHTIIVADLPDSIVEAMADRGKICIPTMIMMEGLIGMLKELYPKSPVDMRHVLDSVHRMHSAGITILAGSDANDQKGTPFQPPHGISLHDELELLVEAGLTPIEALRSATSLPARIFGLNDRGTIACGKRADLVLVEGDPTENICATRDIRGVWIGGVEVGLGEA